MSELGDTFQVDEQKFLAVLARHERDDIFYRRIETDQVEHKEKISDLEAQLLPYDLISTEALV
jgi:hypothetical protein